jgi:hypothetical protein
MDLRNGRIDRGGLIGILRRLPQVARRIIGPAVDRQA